MAKNSIDNFYLENEYENLNKIFCKKCAHTHTHTFKMGGSSWLIYYRLTLDISLPYYICQITSFEYICTSVCGRFIFLYSPYFTVIC